MITHYGCHWYVPAVFFFVVLLCSGSMVNLRAQAGGTVTRDASVKVPTYEVASIKPSGPGDPDSGWKTLPDGFDAKNVPLAPLINQAYGIQMDSQISGLPAWAKNDHYSVSARVDGDTAEAWKKLSKHDQWKQQQLMLQAFFAERCQLKMRRELKELPVYDLVIAKGGVKMKEAAPDEQESGHWKQTAYYSATSQGDEFTMTVTTHAGTADGLTQSLPHYAGRIIVDKTGLGGKRFDYELKWSTSGQAPPDSGDVGPTLFKALEEQLGLKLKPAKEPVDTFVVEQMERPSAD